MLQYVTYHVRYRGYLGMYDAASLFQQLSSFYSQKDWHIANNHTEE